MHDDDDAEEVVCLQGALCGDAVLAGAIWRNIFHTKCADVSHLELMVDYTRRQVRFTCLNDLVLAYHLSLVLAFCFYAFQQQ